VLLRWLAGPTGKEIKGPSGTQKIKIPLNAFESRTYEVGSVVSSDGTTVGYRRFGHGPPIVLVHGGMQASQNLMKLGTGLADTFTIIIPDRRGRGLSGPHRVGHGINTECEDIEAVLRETGAHNLFGLSVGALIALWVALATNIENLAIYEPPLPVGDTDPAAWLPRFDREMAQGKLAAAMLTVMRGTVDPPSLRLLPRFLLIPLLNFAIEAEAKKVKHGDVPVKQIIPTMHFDAAAVNDTKGCLEGLRRVTAKVLLLGGGKSP